MSAAEVEIEPGWVARELGLELPGLALASAGVGVGVGGGAHVLDERLAFLADRLHGSRVVALRTEPVVATHRAFFRQIGLDPDVQHTPLEAAALGRMLAGGFPSRGALEDALLIAVVETGVGVWALDDARVDGPLGLRGARAGELPAGRIVVADAHAPVAALFGALAGDRCPGPATRRLRLFAVQVPGVPAIHVEEALWTCAQAVVEASEAR